MEYLNASAIENIDPLQVETLNRHAITLDNSISFEVNTDTIFTTNEMFSDPEYDPLREKTWWELNWKKAVQWIAFTVVLIVSIVLMCIPPTHGFGVGMFVAGLRAAISGFIFGGLIGGLISLVSGNNFMEGFVEGAVDGFINGFTTGAILYCASQAVSSIVKAVNNRCKIPGECFIAGTLVMTSIGSKPIEEIQVGDEVWAYDEETGEKSLKKVVNLFRNTTKKWIHLLFEFENGNTEEIVCTEGHPFYVNNFGWIVADKLFENDEVLLYTNKKAIVLEKEIQILAKEETTYNFEVEDFHTYYVGSNEILVHNECGKRAAMRAAKRSENIPMNQKTDSIELSLEDMESLKMIGENGRVYYAEIEFYGNKFIRNDFSGHLFKDGTTIGRHFNIGTWSRDFSGKLIMKSNGLHFFYTGG